MYKRCDQNSFPVAVAASKKFSDEREGEEGERERERERERKNHYGGRRDYAIEFPPPRRQMEAEENEEARAKGCRLNDHRSVARVSRAPYRCISCGHADLI